MPAAAPRSAPRPPEGAVRLYRWTRKAYERAVEAGVFPLDLRAELLDGQIVEKMSPQGSRHTTALRLVTRALEVAFGDGVDVRAQAPLSAGARSQPEPDVAVVPGSVRDYRDAHPEEALLVVEVADTTLRTDRGRKARIYAQAGFPEYWIVNLPGACLEVHRDPAGDAYRTKTTLAAGDTVAPLARPGAAIPVADLLP
jgi:Uma2 family endonuclease